MKLTLGFSPCPNDTFIFDAMVHGRIDTGGLEFDYFLADVEELNRRAFEGKIDILKMSYHAYAFAARDYLILDSGSALGWNNGPLLISKRPVDKGEIQNLKIAIPGLYTTANLLFSIAWPEAGNKKEYLFSDIEDALINEEVDLGLIIHETRFTYQKRGLKKVADMGEYWQNLTGLPIPLGTVAINRSVSGEIAGMVNRILRRSLEYAYSDSAASGDFITANAAEIDPDVTRSHIRLYVNEFTMNLGEQGRMAVEKLLNTASSRKVVPEIPPKIFLTE